MPECEVKRGNLPQERAEASLGLSRLLLGAAFCLLLFIGLHCATRGLRYAGPLRESPRSLRAFRPAAAETALSALRSPSPPRSPAAPLPRLPPQARAPPSSPPPRQAAPPRPRSPPTRPPSSPRSPPPLIGKLSPPLLSPPARQPSPLPSPPFRGKVHPSDAAILLSAKKLWGGGKVLPSWDARSACGKWEGVQCDSTGRVIQVYVKSSGLSGSFPSSLGNLTRLQSLNMYDNAVSGSLPSSIGNLVSLTYLSLDFNELSGSLPSSIGNISGLQYLSLWLNHLQGSLPSTIGNLVRLKELYLSYNQLSGSLPNSIGSLTGLEYLSLHTNQLSGSLPSTIGNLSALEFLYLYSNRFSGAWPSSISKLTGLYGLDVSGNKLTGTPPPTRTNVYPSDAQALLVARREWGADRQLSSWDVSQPWYQWEGVECKEGRVTSLQLRAYNLTGSIPDSLGNLPALSSVDLSSNLLTGYIPSNLWELDGHVDLSDNFLAIYGYCPSESPPVDLTNNCNLDCPSLLHKTPSTCSRACGTNQPLGPCQGRGTCFLTGPDSIATCVCDKGFVSPSWNRGTCAKPGAKAPPPSPPRDDAFAADAAALIAANEEWGISTLRDSWDPTSPCTRWEGVVCDGTGRVISLQLQDYGISGRIPPVLCNLTALQTVNMSGNALNGSLPSLISRLSALQSLDLHSNKLSEALPPSIGKLSNLQFLWLDYNQLSGPIPSSLGNMIELTYLSMCANYLGGTIPANIGNLVGLQKLDVSQNRLSGSVPSSIGSLVELQYLYLYANDLTGPLPSTIGNLVQLQDLQLSRNELSGSLPSTIGNLIQAQFLWLDNNRFSGSLPSSIGNITGLQRLFLRTNQLSGSLPSTLGRLTALQDLSVPSNQLSGSIPSSLGNLVRLEWLDLSQNQLSGVIPSSLGNLRGVQNLYLWSNQLSGSLPSSIGNLRALKELSVASNQLSGSLPSSLGNLVELQYLGLHTNQLSGSIPSSVGYLIKLQALSLQSNQLSGSLPSGLGNLTALFTLDLRYNQLSGSLPSSVSDLILSMYKDSRVPQLWDNYFSGSCPSSDLLISDNPTRPRAARIIDGGPGGWGLGEYPRSPLSENCFPASCGDASISSQQGCAYACGSDQPTGPCRGHGNCLFVGANRVPTCLCNSGFANNGSDTSTCVRATGSAPPPPPAASRDVTQGVTFFDQTPTSALNRWSRYLSSKYLVSNGVPTWNILTASSWMSPGSMFIGYNPHYVNQTTTGVLQWPGTRDQGACAACWAVVASDAVAAAQTIATSSTGGSIPALSVTQVLQCSANGTTPICSGGYPTSALEYAADSALLSNASFLEGSSCSSIPPPPAIIMYEAVQFRGWFGLLLTLQKQPALVILEAGAPFQNPTCVRNLVFQDPSCYSGNLNHSVLVVGYDIATTFPYWVIRNSWGSSWCTNGFMRLAIQGGSGVCGMNVLPAYYPVAAPSAGDPCYKKSSKPNGDPAPALNPCGGGTCKAAPKWGSYSYTCTCPIDFVPVNNTVRVTLPGAGQGITQTCAPVDACGLTLTNPCDVGTCVNDGAGSYSCLCPIGYFSDTTADGRSTCSIGRAPAQLVVQPGMTCCLISATYNLTREQLLSQNPGLDCSSLRPGQVVNTANPSFSCAVAYTVTSEYVTFEEIANIVLRPNDTTVTGISAAELLALNPAANCSEDETSLAPGQVICLRAGPWQGPLTCNKLYTMQGAETCRNVTDRSPFTQDPILFYAMNPGIDCSKVSNPGPGADGKIGATGVAVCVGSEPVGARKCPSVTTRKNQSVKTVLYAGKKGDNCFKLLNNHPNCKKFKNRSLYRADDFRTTNPVPDCSKVAGYQFCCPE